MIDLARRATTFANAVLMFNIGMSPTAMSSFIQIFQGLLTPVIAGIAVYIAYQQWKVNKRKYDLDRYERRLRIYQRVVEMLRLIIKDYKLEFHDLPKFSADTAEADFLFGGEISEYISEFYTHAVNLCAARAELRDSTHNQTVPANFDRRKVVDAIAREEMWFLGQHDVAKERFKKYLDISR